MITFGSLPDKRRSSLTAAEADGKDHISEMLPGDLID